MLPIRPLPFRPLFLCALSVLLVTPSSALAQPPNPFGLPQPAGPPGSKPPQATRPAPPPPPPSSPVIARVEGRPITQEAFDRIAGPYFAQVKAQLGESFDDKMRTIAARNVLQELIRRDAMMVIAQRRRIAVTDADVDRLLSQDPIFLTNGKFDPTKLTQFKFNPGSNYPALLPHLRELAAAARLDSAMRVRLKPSRAALREEWSRRNEQVRFRFLPMALRDVPLDPEASEAEQASYYTSHPDAFRRKARVNLRYFSLPLPPPGDSLRASAEAAALARGRRLRDSLRAGAALDSLVPDPGGVQETGFMNLPVSRLPRLGIVPDLLAALAGAESDTTRRPLAPVVAGNQVIVSEIAAVQPSRLPPLAEVRAEVKRQADLDKRRTTLDTERRAWFAAHPDSFRTAVARVTRVVMDDPDRAARALPALLSGWSAGRDVKALARSAGARIETLSVARGGSADSLFGSTLVDSMLAGPAASKPGPLQGPRRFGARTVVWRVEALDPAQVPAYEAVRPRAEAAYQEEKRRRDEEEARQYFEAHRAEYRSPPRLVVDYITVKVPPLDSVKVPEGELRKYYQAHLDQYRQGEEVHARHILISARAEAPPPEQARARSLADSLLRLIRGGADFGDLARRFSQDPGSAPRGGDLGFFPRGRMVPEFNDSAFALQPGQVSGLVRTSFGFHILKVEERHTAGTRPFEDVKAVIQNLVAQANADSLARRRAESIRQRIARGASAMVMALEVDSLRTSPPFAAGEQIGSVGWAEGLFEDLAKLPVGRWAPRVYRAGSAYLVVRGAQHLPEGPAEFEAVRGRAIEDMRNAKRRAILEERIANVRQSLAAGATLDSAAAPFGGLKDSGFLTHAGGNVPGLGVEPKLIATAFTLGLGQVTDTLTTAVGVAWIRTEEKRSTPGADFERDQAAVESELLGQAYSAWLEREKKTMKIEILRPELRPEVMAVPAKAAAGAGSAAPARTKTTSKHVTGKPVAR